MDFGGVEESSQAGRSLDCGTHRLVHPCAWDDFNIMKIFSLDSFKLEGKTTVVTGGCGNLGPYWVMALMEAGAKVAIIDLPETNTPEILEKYAHNQLKVFYADITDLKTLHTIHENINKELGKVEILVTNAGIDVPPIRSNNNEDPKALNKRFSKMWAVNVQGMVNCIEEFCPDMKKTGGSIINIGSLYMERSPFAGLYTHLGFDKPWAYGATKAAVGQVTRHYSTRLAKYGIRVNTLSPGGVLATQDKVFIAKFSSRVPQGRMANKESDLGGPLIFLASDASSYVTGANLQVNGGYTAW